ncbi:MAG: IS110 family transposase [Chloroflexi bacterium]|nr:MAG: IS110 family transposase [Chloroflexota bacterium]TMF41926.1 MAG: IS110 family transposase [Chloroflexota bacterium]
MKEGITRYLGLDAHKATITVAIGEASGPPTLYGTIANDPSAVSKLIRRLGRAASLVAAYEAGPTGYTLHRQLTALGVECVVVAPSLIPRRAGDRVKTDNRDAVTLARLLRSGDLTPVWVPEVADEALRDLVRARYDAKADLLRARHRLGKFLLRQGGQPPAGTRAWTIRYQTWLSQLRFQQPAAQVVFDDYRATIRAAEDRIRRLEADLRRCATDSRQVALIAALQALRGIGFLSAVTIVAETFDLRRFARARGFMGFTGLTSSEHSSGPARWRGAITRTGNAYLRHVLIQAAHNARHAPRQSAALKQRQAGLPPDLVELAWRAQLRLHQRYRHLSGRLGRPKAVTAVARELAGFVWAIGQRMAAEAPAA